MWSFYSNVLTTKEKLPMKIWMHMQKLKYFLVNEINRPLDSYILLNLNYDNLKNTKLWRYTNGQFFDLADLQHSKIFCEIKEIHMIINVLTVEADWHQEEEKITWTSVLWFRYDSNAPLKGAMLEALSQNLMKLKASERWSGRLTLHSEGISAVLLRNVFLMTASWK